MQEKQFLSDLKKNFRLNIYEAKIWTSLLSRGIASAGELADISGVPRSRCYDVLESLEKKGFIIMKMGKPIKYLAMNPQIIMERVKNDIRNEAYSMQMQFDSIKESEEFKEIELLHKTGIQHVDIPSISKSIVGRTAINKFIKQILSNARTSVIYVTGDDHLERSAKLLKGFMGAFAKKKVCARLYSPYNKAALKKIEGIEFIEHYPSTKFVSVDGKEMLFLVSSKSVAPEYEVAVWIHSPFFVGAINVLFEGSLRKN